MVSKKRDRAPDSEVPMDIDVGVPPQASVTKRRKVSVSKSSLPTSSGSAVSSGLAVALHKKDPLAHVTEGSMVESSWIQKANKLEFSSSPSALTLSSSNYDAIAELNSTTSSACHPGESGWIQPLRKYFGIQKLQQNRADIWDRWAHAHWRFVDYRNRIGVFADVPSLAEFFRPFHKHHLQMAERFISFYKDKIDQGRKNIETDALHWRKSHPSILDHPDISLEKLKANRAFLKFVVKVLRCRSPAGVKRVCDDTLAYLVTFVRNGYKPGKGLKLRAKQYLELD